MDRWTTNQIIAARPALERPEQGDQPLDVLLEKEPTGVRGRIAEVLTIMLRGSECSFHCLMCDLWRFTHVQPTLPGAIPTQIRNAFQRFSSATTQDADHLGPVAFASENPRWVKLYNASNFFAHRNVPEQDLDEIARLVIDFDRVIVENHPRLMAETIPLFSQRITGRLEIAMGLEIADDHYLSWLNKQASVNDFRKCIDWLTQQSIDTRLFVLLKMPGMSERQAIDACLKTVDCARAWGARHVSIIPMRSGDGVMRQLTQVGTFTPPLASSLEYVLSQSVGQAGTIVTADLWDWDRLTGHCRSCRQARRQRLEQVNLQQSSLPLPKTLTCSCLTAI